MIIEKDKLYKTRDGRKARIYATDGAKGSIHGAILHDTEWAVTAWNKDGCYYAGEICSSDLISEWVEPVKLEFEREVYSYGHDSHLGVLRISFKDSSDELFHRINRAQLSNKKFKVTLEEIV